MTEHDKAVLEVARNFLKNGEDSLFIGEKVVSRKKIVQQLRKEFPQKKIKIYGNVDYSYEE